MERICTINKTQQENKQYFFNKEIFFKGSTTMSAYWSIVMTGINL